MTKFLTVVASSVLLYVPIGMIHAGTPAESRAATPISIPRPIHATPDSARRNASATGKMSEKSDAGEEEVDERRLNRVNSQGAVARPATAPTPRSLGEKPAFDPGRGP
jgi:hypothetical protein